MTRLRVWPALRMAVMGAAGAVLVAGPAFGAFSARATVSPVAGDAASGGPVSYLALGDSLAFGEQPNGVSGKGYVDDLWRDVRQEIPSLRLRNVSCPGETSHSLITGRHSPCDYAAGSQLDAAVAFLEAHPEQVAFITLNIGSNDLFARCLDGDTYLLDKACAVDLRPRLQARLTHIVRTLRTAAGPDVPLLAMTYYNPLLGLWGLVPGGRSLARADQRVWSVFNAGLADAYWDAGAKVANVAATFRTGDFTHTVVVPDRGRLPVNVALACRWTWFCSANFTGDPHANQRGYRKIAGTFDRLLHRHLR
jgi:lysophospholipase L1-like esterase